MQKRTSAIELESHMEIVIGVDLELHMKVGK